MHFCTGPRAWGFNRRGDIECFPKTEKLTQVLLPNEPNEDGGDTYKAGTFESWAVKSLPSAPSNLINKETLDFLRGFVASGYRNDALNAAAFYLAKKRILQSEARDPVPARRGVVRPLGRGTGEDQVYIRKRFLRRPAGGARAAAQADR